MVKMIGTGGVRRNGRIFAPIPLVTDNNGPLAQEISKKTENAQQRKYSLPTNEVDEFLRIIKRSDYRVVNQLNQTLSKISIWSLLMCSEALRDALVKFLKSAHVSQEISVCQFKGVVNNISSSISQGFND